MLIVGAKGFAKEVLEVCKQNNELENLVFYDDVSTDIGDRLFGLFPILKNQAQVISYFENIDKRFTIGIGNPKLRIKMFNLFTLLNGNLISTISVKADIGSYDMRIGKGANILDGVKISNSVTIGIGSIVYYNSVITHDCIIGDFVEISPNSVLLGRVSVGDFSQIGSGSTILPNVKIGKGVIVGAGAVVTKDLPDNCVAVGVPAKIIKYIQI